MSFFIEGGRHKPRPAGSSQPFVLNTKVGSFNMLLVATGPLGGGRDGKGEKKAMALISRLTQARAVFSWCPRSLIELVSLSQGLPLFYLRFLLDFCRATFAAISNTFRVLSL